MENGTDTERWPAWVERHGNSLLLYARQWAPSVADAEEAVQEGFVRFWRSRHRDAADPAPLLFAAVKRSAIDQARSAQRRQAREQKAVAEAGPAESMFACSLEDEERRAAVQSALARLPEEQRDVLVLKIWAGLTFKQIADSLGVRQNTAASRYRYALAAMRRTLDLEGEP